MNCGMPYDCERHELKAEIARLRDELVNARLERDNIASLNSSLIAELAAHREKIAMMQADLAATEAELASRQIDVDTFRDGNQKLRYELAAKDARIAGLESQLRHMHTFDGQHCARIAELEDKLSTAVWSCDHERADNEALHKRIAELEEQLGSTQTVRKMNAAVAELALMNTRERAESAEARVAELERHLENSGMYGNAGRYWEGRWRDERTGNAGLLARIAELEKLVCFEDWPHHETCLRAERAEARVVAQANEWRIAYNNLQARAERAKAELVAIRKTNTDLYAMNRDQTVKLNRAEAERDALREFLERFREGEARSLVPDQRVLDIIDAALNSSKT